MAFDAFYMSCVLWEIRGLAEPRVEKIHQPARDTLILHLRHREGRSRLLIAANPAAPRLHLTEFGMENPAQPPMFCMLLRKHLQGARLKEVRQRPMERCAEFVFDCVDEMGDQVEKTLVAELMGRTCNVYLLSPQGRILDCLRRVGLDESAKRQALPGLFYQAPEAVEKNDPLAMEQEDFEALLSQPGADLLEQRLMDHLGGLSPLVCREASLFAAGDTQARVSAIAHGPAARGLLAFFREHLAHPKPYFVTDKEGQVKQFAFCPVLQYGSCLQAESFSLLLDKAYGQRDAQAAIRQKGQALRKTVQNLCTRLSRKMVIQEKELSATYDRERLRQLGDIVTANLHKIQRGQTVLDAEDFYDETMAVIQIPLSPLLSPQQNASKFYKDYTRMKNAQRELTKQLSLGAEELSYLKSVLEELDRAGSEQDLEEIRQELAAQGYVKATLDKKKMKQKKTVPMRFVSTNGYEIYVGRNNRQNEELTFKFARKDDLWLHAQKVHGSHVVIACAGAEVPDDTVTQAAQLAAYYAESSHGQNVPVDVMRVKQVKKHPSGKPGMVIYHSYRTVVANPYPDIVVDALNAENPQEE